MRNLTPKEMNDLVRQAKNQGVSDIDTLDTFVQDLPEETSENISGGVYETLKNRLKISRF